MHHCCNFNIMQRLFLHHLLLAFMIWALVIGSNPGEESDRLALLDLKSRVLNDPFGIMNSWNDSTHFCDWVGVTCSNSTLIRVVALNLNARNLRASIPPSMGNMTYLTGITLSNNKLYGHIPQEFGRLLQLSILELSNNSFSGEIPTNISHCNKLIALAISDNELVGQIPHQFISLTKLQLIDCSANNLSGTIPPWIGNFSSLYWLDFGDNNFQGNIPSELGRLPRLNFFAVSLNYLTGTVPFSIYNRTSLIVLSLVGNHFHGTIPSNVGFTLPNIKEFYGGLNFFTGPIPTSFVNASGLQLLDLSQNNLTGTVPHDFKSLRDLKELNVAYNKLGSGKVGDLNFINSLINCSSLRRLGLAINRFGGQLPLSIGNFSMQLTILSLSGNLLSGSIPFGIGNLMNLQFIALNLNYLTGSIPSSFGNLHNLRVVLLEGNKITGPMPSSIGNLSLLTELYLGRNKLEGSIPSSLGQCKSLLSLYLSHNNLNGTIPKEVIGLSSLSIFMQLDHNLLTGPLPNEVGKLIGLTQLDVSDNKLSGHIPSSLGQCISMERMYLRGNKFEGPIPQSLEALKGLEQLDLSRNNLSGPIPQSLEALKGLEQLDLSRNNLSGPIPQFLDSLRSLLFLNLSYNNFEGQVPKEGVFSNSTMISILGNNNLCGGLQVLHLPPCPLNRTHSPNKRFLASKVLVTVVSIVIFTVILLGIFFVCFMLKKKSKNDTSTSSFTKEILPQISYLELSKSTNGFSMDNLIGSGSFGSVYKGVLSNDGSIVAIKVLNLQQQGASKSFVDECNTLSNIRHRNLLKIITSCSSINFQGNEFKALVYHFMSNGNLDYWLHPANLGHNQRRLSLLQRLNIAIDIASGLDYLHNHCETSIVHCDLKPSNILLDDDMVAHVGDFGLARFMLEEPNDQLSFGQTMSLTLKGSIGYMPPEYGSSGRISREGDIFSFGILLLEMIIGKRPTDNIFGEDVDIHSFVATALPHDAMSIVDPSIPFNEMHQDEENGNTAQEMAIMINGEDDRRIMLIWMKECVISILRIGLSCSLRTPRERTPMSIVVVELQAIKKSYLKVKKLHQRYHRYLFPQA